MQRRTDTPFQPVDELRVLPRLTIPQYGCNGGFDTKFITEPREIPGFYQFKLIDALSIQAFTHSIEQINTALKPSRAGGVSMMCLAGGSLLVPLIPFAILTMRRKKLRKKILKQVIGEFNRNNPLLVMRWRRKPVSQLVIEWSDFNRTL